MRLITDKKEIEDLHLKLKKSLEKYKTENLKTKTGHKGYSGVTRVSYSKELNIWWDLDGIAKGNSGERYWNAFGINRPEEKEIQHIVCEINYPVKNTNWRIAGLWAMIENNYVLLHNGKIGGGRKGIGKNGFIDNYTGKFEEFEIEGKLKKYTIIGNLNDKNLPYQIKNFIYEVDRIKSLLVSKKNKSDFADPLETIKHSFNEEFVGTKEYKHRKGKVSSTANHGLVVNNLKKLIEEKGKLVANDQQRDLYIYNNKAKITTVFEVKTSLKSQSIFTAVGQLYVNNIKLNPMPRLVYVIPELPNKKLLETLDKLNIEVLVYTLKKGKTNFHNLERFI